MSGFELTCVIPAWNEAPRIGRVLAAVAGHPRVSRVLVVDDGSTDGTGGVARAAGVEVLATAGNQGKTRALVAGLRAVGTGHVLLLDADLTGLDAAAISALIAPVAAGRAGAALSLRGNAPRSWRLLGLDYITGERVLPMDLLAPRLGQMAALPRFGFEVWLNRRMLEAGMPIAVVDWPGVASPAKAKKQGLVAGLKADARMMGDIFRTVGVTGCLEQISGMLAAKV